MKRVWFGFAVLTLVPLAFCSGQSAPAGKEKTTPVANAQAAAKDVASDLREARGLLKKVGDKKTRERLELLLTRAELRTTEIQKTLAALGSGPKRTLLSAETFAAFLKSVKGNTFDNEKASFVESQASTRYFTSAQARDILKTFSFDDGRVTAGLALYPRVIDPENFFVVYEVFTFDTGRKALRDKLKLK
jgi:hypothetical protein